MMIVGITGGIGCGKSTVSATFVKAGIPIVDADIVARQVVQPNSAGLNQIINMFGSDFLDVDGALRRVKLAALAFADAGAMSKLNKIMLPLIQQESARQFLKLSREGYKLIAYDAALLAESFQAHKYHPLIVVHCSQEQQIERLVSRGLTKEEAGFRLRAQMPNELKLQLADFAVNTNYSKDESVKQTEVIINYLKNICHICN